MAEDSNTRSDKFKSKNSEPSFFYDFFKGSFLCVLEILGCGQILWKLKVRQQDPKIKQLPFKPKMRAIFEPKGIYNGLKANLTSIPLYFALQCGGANFLNKQFKKNPAMNKLLSERWQRIFAAFGGGIGASIVRVPIDVVMMHMNPQNPNFFLTLRSIAPTFRKLLRLYTGLHGTGWRNGLFGITLLEGPKIARSKLEDIGVIPYYSSMFCGPLAGLFGAIATQPIDRSHVAQQWMAKDAKRIPSLITTAYDIYKTGGIQELYAGAVPRTTRIMLTVTLFHFLSKKIDEAFHIKPQELPEAKPSKTRRPHCERPYFFPLFE